MSNKTHALINEWRNHDTTSEKRKYKQKWKDLFGIRLMLTKNQLDFHNLVFVRISIGVWVLIKISNKSL